jgi:predicted metal-dependent hydrolase
VHFVRRRGARRYILRVRPDGTLRVTVPRGGSRAEALRFVERHLPWAVRERARVLAMPLVWTEGTSILLDGRATPIVRERRGSRWFACAGDIIASVDEQVTDLRPAIERQMRIVARQRLTAEIHAVASRLSLKIAAVSIRNQRSRWGSCSRTGRIALNFRLIQMPPSVREYILVHELMHVRQPNHSRRFWRLVESECPDFRSAERWLKTTGRTLF